MIEVRAPSRLHFGLLAHGGSYRQFGGVGLMVQKPDTVVCIEEANEFTATGPSADRAVRFARTFVERCRERGITEAPLGGAIRIVRAPRTHAGLGSGTQLGMAVARALALMIDRDDWDAAQLSTMVGRGERSAIGAYGFFTGGLIVEAGKIDEARLSPLVVQQPFCDDWRIVLICPRHLEGLAGESERQAFAAMATISDEATARMCRLVLMGLVPGVLEADLPTFGEALYDLQQIAGGCFRQAQGGVYADPLLADIVKFLRDRGVPGVGQSSWGPALYAFTANQRHALELADQVRDAFDLTSEEIIVTEADNHGAVTRNLHGSAQSVR